MSAPILASNPALFYRPCAVSPPVDREMRYDRCAPSMRQLGVIPVMLSTLDTLTTAGQRHIMSKVLLFLGDQSAHARGRMSGGNQRALAELLGQLAHESERSLPDVQTFVRHAQGLVTLLSAIA